MSVTEDLRQIFRILPILAARRQMPIRELMTIGDYRKRSDLLRDLERLMMIGIPPYSPADYFDVEITGTDVILHSDLNFKRPLSLTPAEWNLLKQLIEEERRLTSDAALPAEEANGLLEALGSVPVHFIETGREADFRRMIEGALEEKRSIAMRYTNVDGPEERDRHLDPWVLFEHNRSRYLVARDRDLDESRVFRLDRIHSLSILSSQRESDPPLDIGALRQPSRDSARTIRVRFRFPASLLPGLQREFRFEVETDVEGAAESRSASPGLASESARDAAVVGRLDVSSLDFFRWYLRAYAPFLEVLEPEELRQWIIEEACEFPMPALLSG